MSRLSVFWPDDSVLTKTDEPMILPFPRRPHFLGREANSKSSGESSKMDVVKRARALYANRTCRDCGYPVVEPIELPDSAVNLSGLSIPGTATLVGFRCCGCEAEWSV